MGWDGSRQRVELGRKTKQKGATKGRKRWRVQLEGLPAGRLWSWSCLQWGSSNVEMETSWLQVPHLPHVSHLKRVGMEGGPTTLGVGGKPSQLALNGARVLLGPVLQVTRSRVAAVMFFLGIQADSRCSTA